MINGKSNVFASRPIRFNSVQLVERVQQVLSGGFGFVLDAEVVDYQCERDRQVVMEEEAGCGRGFAIFFPA